jgi:ZIP family zinc transporter
MMIVAIALGAFCATFAGGLVALRLKDRLHLVLGFSAGAVIGVAFFDLLPEALDLGGGSGLFDYTAIGFLSYLVLDRIIVFRAGEHHHGNARKVERGFLGAGSLSAHSCIDGIAIGLAFQASPAVGIVVAIAVLTHDFADGINTMNVVLKNGGTRAQALRWLSVDAVAPCVGIAATFFFTVPDKDFGAVLGLFSGFFLYIGASDLIPESHHAHPKILTTVTTLLGAAALYFAVAVAGR